MSPLVTHKCTNTANSFFADQASDDATSDYMKLKFGGKHETTST